MSKTLDKRFWVSCSKERVFYAIKKEKIKTLKQYAFIKENLIFYDSRF